MHLINAFIFDEMIIINQRAGFCSRRLSYQELIEEGS